MMIEKKNKIVKYILIGGVFLNLALCLNLYRQMLSIQYQVTQLKTDTMSAIQALSRYTWEIKNSNMVTLND
jgi:hypothetical protein